MRILELLTVFSLVGIIIVRMIRKNRPISLWEYSLVIPAALHITIEGTRWQMYVIYLLVALVVLFHLLSDFNCCKLPFAKKQWPRFTGIILAVFTLVLLFLFPVNDLKEPIGPFNVGTMTYDLTDDSRTELYGDRRGESRKIRIQLWYPASDDAKGEVAKWIEDGTVVPRGLMQRYDAPFFVYDHITLIDSNSIIDAPLKNDILQMPVVIISHGWTGFRNLHTDLGELFASMGYLAISIDHTYGSVGLVFDDDEAVSMDPDALPERGQSSLFDSYAENLVDAYSGDTGTVIKHLNYLNSDSEFFRGHIDLDSIGVIGHSTGGGGVVKQAVVNPAIDVVIGLDPWVEPIGEKMLSGGLPQPTMFFRSTSWTGGINDEFIQILTSNDSVKISNYEITESSHQDFSMLYQMGPLPRLLGISGNLNGFKSAEIQQAFISNYMNHHLLGKPDETPDLLDKYNLVFEVDYTNEK